MENRIKYRNVRKDWVSKNGWMKEERKNKKKGEKKGENDHHLYCLFFFVLCMSLELEYT